MPFTATARSVGGTLHHEVDVNGRHTIITDEPERLGGSDQGPAPHELLASMLASCISTMIVLYAQRRDWELGEVSVDVTYDPESTPRRAHVLVHLPTGLTPDQEKRLRRVSTTCPARRALESPWEFEEEFVFDQAAMAAN